MEYLDNIGKRAQAAKPDLQHLKSEEKNQILRKSADDLKLHATEILAANEKDMEKGRTNGMSQGLLDRLLLTEGNVFPPKDDGKQGICRYRFLVARQE